MRRLSVGYLVDDESQPDLVVDLIEKSRTAQHYSVDYLIVQKFASSKNRFQRGQNLFRQHGIRALIAILYFKAIVALEWRLFVRDPELRSVFYTRPLDTLDVPKISVRPLRSKNGLIYRYREDDIRTIRSLNIDVLLYIGSATPSGELVSACKFGVVSIEHGNHSHRDVPPGFWEVFDREPSTSFAIRAVPDESAGDDAEMTCDNVDRYTFIRGSIATQAPYARNIAQIHKKSTVFTHRFLENLGRTRVLPKFAAGSPRTHRVRTTFSLRVVVLYQFKTLITITRRRFNRVSGRCQRWGVAYQFADRMQTAELSKSTFIANPPYRFLADPFVLRRGGMDLCFVEDYDFRTERGKITVFKIDGNEYHELGPALDEPFHLSYPFIFTVDDELYMCPETVEIREIRLYKCIEFPLRWSLHKILLKDVSAVDTNIFWFKDRWWLLTTIDSSETAELCSELHVFYSDAFDSDEWTPHPNNPVIFDSQRARSGGLLHEGEALLRVYQKQGFDQYGKSMGIARITELSPQLYREEVVTEIEPCFAPKLIGTHTFSYDHGLLAVDFLRVERVRASR